MRSKEIRKLALDRLSDGKSIAEIASFLEVTEQTVRNWTKKEPIYGVGRVCRVDKRRLSPEQEEKVLRFVAERPGVFQADIVKYVSETFAVEITRFTASRILRRNAITQKRGTRVNTRYYVERGMQFLDEMRFAYSPLTASIDEMSVMLNIAPLYGYAPRGQRAIVRQPSKRTVSYMLILCICPVGVLYWSLRSGTMDAEAFCETLKRLPDGITLMLDNARTHHATKCLSAKGLPTVAQLAASKSISLRFTPAYAPHLNPVEFTFNTVRNLLRRKEAWTERKLMDALQDLFTQEAFSEASMKKMFKSVIFGGSHPGDRLRA